RLGVPRLRRRRTADVDLGQVLHQLGERPRSARAEREAVARAHEAGVGPHLDGDGVGVGVVVPRAAHGTREGDGQPVDDDVGDLELHRTSPRHCARRSLSTSSESTMTMDAADTSAVAANSSGAWKPLASDDSTYPMPRRPANISTTSTPSRQNTTPSRMPASTVGTMAGSTTFQ